MSNFLIKINGKLLFTDEKKYNRIKRPDLFTTLTPNLQLNKQKINYKGLGYKITKFENKIFFKIGLSHITTLTVPDPIKILKVKKYKIVAEGLNKIVIGNFLQKIYKLRKCNAYKHKGFIKSNQIIKFKTIKKK
jgi:ribosomal protein L6P/L9E